ncbi:hypothetical protein FACS189485_10640 [Spirochaetia bacterium]|nr:hypothetical protein FACS189485_10640 [Spirochaetia bacterium]
MHEGGLISGQAAAAAQRTMYVETVGKPFHAKFYPHYYVFLIRSGTHLLINIFKFFQQ